MSQPHGCFVTAQGQLWDAMSPFSCLLRPPQASPLCSHHSPARFVGSRRAWDTVGIFTRLAAVLGPGPLNLLPAGKLLAG